MTGNGFDDLNLSEMLQVSSADAEHSELLYSQSRAMQNLSDSVGDGLDAIIAGRDRLESGGQGWSQLESLFEGTAAEATFQQLGKLLRRGTDGHAKLREQPRIFENLSQETTVTHTRMSELRDERDKWLALVGTDPDKVAAKFGGSPGSPASLRRAVRDEYNQQARHYMRGTTRGYIKSARNLEWNPLYRGPRSPRPEDTWGPAGWHPVDTPGPELQRQPEDVSGPQLQSGPMVEAQMEHTTRQAPPPGPANKPLTPMVGAALGSSRTKNAGKGKAKNKKSKSRAEKTDVTPRSHLTNDRGVDILGNVELQGVTTTEPDDRDGYQPGTPAADGSGDGRYITDRTTTSPVIGGRTGGGGFGSTPSSPAVDNRGGLLPPVIGARYMPPSHSGQEPTGPRGVVLPQQDGQAAPRRTFMSNAPGARSYEPAPHLAEGKVIRSGLARPEPQFQAREFSRTPRIIHGGEELNRAVVRNPELPNPPPAVPEPPRPDAGPAAPPANDWYDATHVVPPVIGGKRGTHHEEEEFNPGPFITHYNLGRQS